MQIEIGPRLEFILIVLVVVAALFAPAFIGPYSCSG